MDGGRRVSLRKKTQSTRYSGEEYNFDGFMPDGYVPDYKHINVDDEIKTWDFFYTYDKTSDYPFSGFDTADAVRLILIALSKSRPKRRSNLILPSDVVLEVGHGKFPLIWDLRAQFDKFLYIGVEFSTIAFDEAVRHRFNNTCSADEVFDERVEFHSAKSLNYFNYDGSSNLDLIFPTNFYKSRFKAGVVTIALAKSFLDYLSCRLTLSVSISNWNLEPRIPQGVVEMFDSISIALKNSSFYDKLPALFILVEPDNIVKFKDHIGIITKVIYTSTFVKESPSRHLRLIYAQRDKKTKAVCYTLGKFNNVYKNYTELREDMYKVASNAYSMDQSTDEDWLLPYKVPPKWLSNDHKDFDNLTLI